MQNIYRCAHKQTSEVLNNSGFVQILESPGFYVTFPGLESPGISPRSWKLVESHRNANSWCDQFFDDLSE